MRSRLLQIYLIGSSPCVKDDNSASSSTCQTLLIPPIWARVFARLNLAAQPHVSSDQTRLSASQVWSGQFQYLVIISQTSYHANHSSVPRRSEGWCYYLLSPVSQAHATLFASTLLWVLCSIHMYPTLLTCDTVPPQQPSFEDDRDVRTYAHHFCRWHIAQRAGCSYCR